MSEATETDDARPREARLLAQETVYFGAHGFVVSTSNRKCSAVLADDLWYAETLVWEWDQATQTRGMIVGQYEDSVGSLRAHRHMVKRIRETGYTDDAPEDDE
jgi:hypothetical protein